MRKTVILMALLLISICSQAQIEGKKMSGYINAEFSTGLAGYASDYDYISAGIAGSIGMLYNDKYFIGVGIKPNYISSDGDFEGFFMPVYGEFKCQTPLNDRIVGGFGLVRVGYSPLEKKGMYAHTAGGVMLKNWDFGLGISYQFCKFKEAYDDYTIYADYHMVFLTLSVGYRF